ncbi:Uncharacterised protein [Weissella viridescens]|uniref:Uncharacterized protein n=1 Tax=Weissella viridescens TaxID=1629 RepID=A0A380NXT3_WEIVI|nr:Uncharacterised protein [Weissella viridescens]
MGKGKTNIAKDDATVITLTAAPRFLDFCKMKALKVSTS